MGREAIEEMMTGFFSRFPDVQWSVEEYRQDADGSVLFDFAMNATSAETGEKVSRAGRERIFFGNDGLITHVEVTVTSG
mgnify:CR=1 FL=1